MEEYFPSFLVIGRFLSLEVREGKQEKCTFVIRFALSHQTADRKTNEDKAVMVVCEPPCSDPLAEQREGMKFLSFFHQTKNDLIS